MALIAMVTLLSEMAASATTTTSTFQRRKHKRRKGNEYISVYFFKVGFQKLMQHTSLYITFATT